MHTYTEILQFDKAFKAFLQKRKQQPEIVIHYYIFYGRTKAHHFAFIGYKTTKQGLHGIHYDGTTFNYYFGTKNDNIKSELIHLMPPQVKLIPSHLTDGMLKVCNEKISIKIKNTKVS